MHDTDTDGPLLPWTNLLAAVVAGLAVAAITIALDWPYMMEAIIVLSVAVLILAVDWTIRHARPATQPGPQRPVWGASAATLGVPPSPRT